MFIKRFSSVFNIFIYLYIDRLVRSTVQNICSIIKLFHSLLNLKNIIKSKTSLERYSRGSGLLEICYYRLCVQETCFTLNWFLKPFVNILKET